MRPARTMPAAAPVPTLPHPLRRFRLQRPVRLAAVLALLASLAAGLLARQAVPRRLAESSDPLASLAAGAPSRLWDLAFWTGQQAGGTALWRGALLACRGRRGGAYPNCTSVRLARWGGPPVRRAAWAGRGRHKRQSRLLRPLPWSRRAAGESPPPARNLPRGLRGPRGGGAAPGRGGAPGPAEP